MQSPARPPSASACGTYWRLDFVINVSWCSSFAGCCRTQFWQRFYSPGSIGLDQIPDRDERLDPVISPGVSGPPTFRGNFTEEDLNSEVELLESADVLRQVAVSCGLASLRPVRDFPVPDG